MEHTGYGAHSLQRQNIERHMYMKYSSVQYNGTIPGGECTQLQHSVLHGWTNMYIAGHGREYIQAHMRNCAGASRFNTKLEIYCNRLNTRLKDIGLKCIA